MPQFSLLFTGTVCRGEVRMLHVPSYRRRWEEKLAWYKNHSILTKGEGAGSKGTLITTRDGANGSIDSQDIDRVMTEVLVF